MKKLERLFAWLDVITRFALIIGFIVWFVCLFTGCVSTPPPVTKTVTPPAVVIAPVLTKTSISWNNKPGVIYAAQYTPDLGVSWFTIASNTVSPVEFDCWTPGALVRVGARPAGSSVTLAWSDPQTNVTFNLFIGTASGVYPVIVSGITSQSFTASNLTAGAKYFFAAAAQQGTNQSALSNEVSYQPPAPDLSVSNLSIHRIP